LSQLITIVMIFCNYYNIGLTVSLSEQEDLRKQVIFRKWI